MLLKSALEKFFFQKIKRNGFVPFLLQCEEAYLVTGNKKHFPVKPYVVTPRELPDILENLPE